MPIILSLFFACGPQPLEFTTSVEGCQDVEFDQTVEPTLEYSVGDPVRVWLNGVWLPQDSVLDASVSSENGIIAVSEAWTEGTSEDTFCFAPTVTFQDAGAGRYEVFWYRDGDDIAFDSIVFEVE